MYRPPATSKEFILPISGSYNYRDERIRLLREERSAIKRRDPLSTRSSSTMRVETFDRSKMHNSQRSFGYGDIPSAKYVKRRNSLAQPVIEQTRKDIAAINESGLLLQQEVDVGDEISYYSRNIRMETDNQYQQRPIGDLGLSFANSAKDVRSSTDSSSATLTNRRSARVQPAELSEKRGYRATSPSASSVRTKLKPETYSPATSSRHDRFNQRRNSLTATSSSNTGKVLTRQQSAMRPSKELLRAKSAAAQVLMLSVQLVVQQPREMTTKKKGVILISSRTTLKELRKAINNQLGVNSEAILGVAVANKDKNDVMAGADAGKGCGDRNHSWMDLWRNRLENRGKKSLMMDDISLLDDDDSDDNDYYGGGSSSGSGGGEQVVLHEGDEIIGFLSIPNDTMGERARGLTASSSDSTIIGDENTKIANIANIAANANTAANTADTADTSLQSLYLQRTHKDPPPPSPIGHISKPIRRGSKVAKTAASTTTSTATSTATTTATTATNATRAITTTSGTNTSTNAAANIRSAIEASSAANKTNKVTAAATTTTTAAAEIAKINDTKTVVDDPKSPMIMSLNYSAIFGSPVNATMENLDNSAVLGAMQQIASPLFADNSMNGVPSPATAVGKGPQRKQHGGRLGRGHGRTTVAGAADIPTSSSSAVQSAMASVLRVHQLMETQQSGRSNAIAAVATTVRNDSSHHRSPASSPSRPSGPQGRGTGSSNNAGGGITSTIPAIRTTTVVPTTTSLSTKQLPATSSKIMLNRSFSSDDGLLSPDDLSPGSISSMISPRDHESCSESSAAPVEAEDFYRDDHRHRQTTAVASSSSRSSSHRPQPQPTIAAAAAPPAAAGGGGGVTRTSRERDSAAAKKEQQRQLQQLDLQQLLALQQRQEDSSAARGRVADTGSQHQRSSKTSSERIASYLDLVRNIS